MEFSKLLLKSISNKGSVSGKCGQYNTDLLKFNKALLWHIMGQFL